MDDLEFKSLLKGEISSAVNHSDSEFTAEREETLRYYLGKPFGNEVENRSQVVSTEVSDTVEFMIPSLIKMFTSSPDFVRFQPRTAEDVDAAKQATDLVNFAIYQDNPQFFAKFHNWIKDALLFRTGALKVHWLETDEVETEQYESLTEDEATLLAADPAVEIVAQEVTEVGLAVGGEDVPLERTYSVEIRRKVKAGAVKIDNVPPEELIFSRRATSLEDCDFIGHRTLVRAGDLIAQGYDEDVILRHAGQGFDDRNDTERQTRFEEIESGDDGEAKDPSMREVLITEAYMRCDYDGDNIAELRRVVCLGDGGEILENEPFDKVPFCLLSPILMPHRMIGRSVAELVKDVQLIKSTTLRQQLDNFYLTNNSRVAAVEGQVNLDDLLQSRPGGVVRMRAPGMVQPLAVPQIGNAGFQMLDYMDSVRDQRTGFSKASMGLDPSTLQSTTASAVNATIQGAQLKVEMIARVFAETGCRELATQVLHLLQTHQDAERTVRIRGDFVAIDPRTWENGFDMSIEVGLGNGREDEKMAMLLQIAGKQEQMLQQLGPSNPVCSVTQYVDTLKRIVEMAGFADAKQFFNSGPEVDQALQQQTAQSQQADPTLEIEKMKLEAEIGLKRERMTLEIQLQREKAQAELDLRREELQAELALRQQKINLGGSVSTNLPQA